MTKVCMLAVQHSAMDDRIHYKESKSLLNAGFEVSYLHGCKPNGDITDMGGQILNTKKEQEIEIDGIKVIGIPHASGIIQKSLNKLNQSDLFKKMIAKGIEINADVYHAHEPQSLYIAQKISEKNDAKVIYDAHEPWLQNADKDGALRKLLLPKLKYLIAANEITRGDLLFHNHNLKSEVILNCSVPNIFTPTFNKEKIENPIIVHEGNMWFDRGLKEIIETIRLLKVDFPNVKLRITGETYGEEKDYLSQKLDEYDLHSNLEETGWLPYEKVGEALSDCSIGLITNTNQESNTLAGPANKFFNYLTYGIACVAVDLPETTRLLNATKSGITVIKSNAQNLHAAISTLLNDKGKLLEYCQNAYQAHSTFNWNIEDKKLVDFYDNVVLNETEIIQR